MTEILNESASEIFAVLMGGVVVYVAALMRNVAAAAVAKTEGFLDEQARLRLAQSIERAIAKAEAEAGKVDLALAAEYVREFNSGDLARFGLDGQKLIDRIKGSVAQRIGHTHTPHF